MGKKKSYKYHFRIGGALIGAGFGLYQFNTQGIDLFNLIIKIFGFVPSQLYGVTQSVLIHGLAGWLIGWGIHSLFRRFRK